MPLKHFTETVLVLALAAAIVIAGVLTATLPPLPTGFVPSLFLLGIAFAYPFALAGMLKRNRADYSFRALHFAPAVIVGIWLLFQVLILVLPQLGSFIGFYTWGWTLPAVLVALVLLALFCLHVIRRQIPRLTGIAALFALFAIFAVAGESNIQWKGQIAATLWRPFEAGTALSRSGSQVAVMTQSSSSSSASTRSSASSFQSSHAASSLAMAQENPLASAGPELNFLLLSMVPAYCGVIHARARKRFLGA
jgi:hypothetical protein